MSILKIARIGHPVLHKEALTVKDFNDPEIKILIRDMTDTMLDANGIGLAAPQVYCSKKILIFCIPEDQEQKKDNENNNEIKIMALINPKITKTSKETNNDWEGCLSIPGMLGLVKRFTKITYEGFDLNGNLIKQEAQGLHARIFQHEYDHLMGIVYTQRLTDMRAYGFAEEIDKFWKDKKDKHE
tara:strand:- start:2874 stop:3428 length:555 start_codon:yes stop_codon:yes gene_type:complete